MKRGTLLVVLVALCILGNAACGGGSIFRPGEKSANFTFYAIGEDAAAPVYCVAGVVAIANNASKDGTFAVTGGVQDYNNGDTITSPQPNGDAITGGNLSVGSNGTAVLTIITKNPAVGVDGTETFVGVFPNNSHALITQFDGSATSSGSLDLQTSTALPSGSFSFTSAGAFSSDGETFAPAAFGGVLTVASGAVTGTVDTNIGGDVNLGTSISGVTFTKPNKFGRGTVNGLTSDDVSKPAKVPVVREGAPACSGTGTCLFEALGDLNELFAATPIQLVDTNFEGSFQLPANGYGTMTFEEGFGDTANFGLYGVDPALNILDPNDKTDTTGGNLIAEMDDSLVGTGTIVPQTDTVVADFSGTYAGGGSGDTNEGDEFDFLTLATVTEPDGGFSGPVALSDPFGAITGAGQETVDASFSGNAEPSGEAGRYSFNPLILSSPDFEGSLDMTVAVYQASASQLFWVETDPDIYFGGSLEQFPGSGGADAKKAKPNNTKWQH